MIIFSCHIADFPLIAYVRMTHRSKFCDPRAKEYLANQEALAWEFKQASIYMVAKRPIIFPITEPCIISWEVHVKHNRRVDADNIGKSLADAAEKAGIVKNDYLIRGTDKTRLFQGEKNEVNVELRNGG